MSEYVSGFRSGARLRLGEARLEVTPTAHNGCKKWAQRFGLAPMRLNMASHFRSRRLRGLYLRVIEDGECALGDRVVVVSRPRSAAPHTGTTRP